MEPVINVEKECKIKKLSGSLRRLDDSTFERVYEIFDELLNEIIKIESEG